MYIYLLIVLGSLEDHFENEMVPCLNIDFQTIPYHTRLSYYERENMPKFKRYCYCGNNE